MEKAKLATAVRAKMRTTVRRCRKITVRTAKSSSGIPTYSVSSFAATASNPLEMRSVQPGSSH